MKRVDAEFKNRVFKIVSEIPKGRVMTYGQVATLAGASWAAWEVGQIAHWGASHLPWQRVVNKQGGLAKSWPNGGIEGHKAALISDGVVVKDDNRVDVEKLLWRPNQ